MRRKDNPNSRKGIIDLKYIGVGFVVLLMMILLPFGVQAQKGLIFQKSQGKYAIYQAGDVISFEIKSNPGRITDQIQQVRDTVIVFRTFTIRPEEITYMYIDKKTKDWYFLKYKWSRLCMIVGGTYLVLDAVNTGEVSAETAVFSGALIGAGLLLKGILPPKIKIKGMTRIKIYR